MRRYLSPAVALVGFVATFALVRENPPEPAASPRLLAFEGAPAPRAEADVGPALQDDGAVESGLRVRVRQAGEPMPGAEVLLGEEAKLSDAAGRARYAGCSDRASLFARRGSVVSARVEIDCLALPTDEVLLELGLPGVLRPEVLATGSHKPIEGAEIALVPALAPTARTDDAGRVRIEDLPPGRYALTARARGWLPQRIDDLVVEAGVRRDVDVELVEAGVIEGVVRRADGEPIPNARLVAQALEKKQEPFEALSAADGSFRIGGLFRGPAILDAEAVGFAPQRLKTPAPMKRVQVVLRTGARLEGVVRASAPVAGAEVIVVVRPQHAMPAPGGRRAVRGDDSEKRQLRLTTVTDAEGRYALDSLPPGFAQVLARTPEAQGSGGVSLRDAEVSRRDLELEPVTSALRGRVTVRGSGEPIAVAVVAVRETGLAARTDDGGRFVLAGLFDGDPPSYNLTASAPGFLERSRGDVGANAQGIEFALPRELLVRGRVVDSQGRPITAFEICDERWLSATERVLGGCVPQRSGTGEFMVARDPEPEKPVYLAVAAEGFRTAYLAYRGAGGEGLDLGEIPLEGGRPLLVLVQDPSGMPVSGAQIFEVEAGSGRKRAWMATTERHGEARFWARDGRHCLVAEHPLYAPSAIERCTVEVVENTPWGTTLKLAKAAWVFGCLRDADGSPLAGVGIVDLIDGTSTIADASGCYRLGPLAAGVHAPSLMRQWGVPFLAPDPKRSGEYGALPASVRHFRLREGQDVRIDYRRPSR